MAILGLMQTVLAQSSAVKGDVLSNNKCIKLQSPLLSFRSLDATTRGDVSTIQKFLIGKNFLFGESTGFYGQNTVRAVKAYQQSVGMSPTGNVGPLTKSMIQKETCTKSPSQAVEPTPSLAKKEIITCSNMNYKTCPDGTLMPRDSSCTWLPEKCQNGTTVTKTDSVCLLMDHRACPDGQSMPRDGSCTWLPEKCSSTVKVVCNDVQVLVGGVCKNITRTCQDGRILTGTEVCESPSVPGSPLTVVVTTESNQKNIKASLATNASIPGIAHWKLFVSCQDAMFTSDKDGSNLCGTENKYDTGSIPSGQEYSLVSGKAKGTASVSASIVLSLAAYGITGNILQISDSEGVIVPASFGGTVSP